MRVAYLVAAHGDYEHLERLLNTLSGDEVRFYLHINKRSRMPERIVGRPDVVFVPRVKVYWAGWSLQRAVLNLLTAAHSDRADRYVLISGVDYPVRTDEVIHRTLSQDLEYINIAEGFPDHKPESRLRYYWYDGFDRKDRRKPRTILFTGFERLQRQVRTKTAYPFDRAFTGSTWWALTDAAASHILSYLEDHEHFRRFFQTCFAPDESMFQTILGNSHFRDACVGNITFTDWSGPVAPAPITMEHVALLEQRTTFESPYGPLTPCFARKFSDASGDVVDAIERRLRN
jgi:hypothetical protein